MNLVEGSIDLEGDPPRPEDDMAERVAAMMSLVDQAIELINNGDAAYAADRLHIALRVGMFGVEKEEL